MRILEEKLKQIFGINKVIFDQFELGKEQGALFCDINKVRCQISEGKKSLLVTGTLCVCAPKEKMPLGYFAEKRALAKDENELSLGLDELPVQFKNNNDFYIKNDVEFTYKTIRDFNPPYGVINELDLSMTVE
jgi:hypothetical protein